MDHINCLKQPNSNTTTNMKSRVPNIMNEHFTGIGPTLANNLPRPKELFTEFLDKNKSPATSFSFCPISPNEVKLEILCLTINYMDFTIALSAYLNMQAIL